MDDTHLDPSTSSDRESTRQQAPPESNREPKPESRPQRLGKGLAALLSKPPAMAASRDDDASRDNESAQRKPDANETSTNESDGVMRLTGAGGDSASAAQADEPRGAGSSASSKSSLAADVVENAVATLASHDDRVEALMARLEAAGELLGEVRRREIARAQRGARIAWSVAAGLGLVLLLGLWWSASTIGGQHGELTAARDRAERLAHSNATQAADVAALQTDVVDLTGHNAALNERAAGLSRELDQTRSALARANEVIDQLMRDATSDAATGQASDGAGVPSERLADAGF